jgi:ubiquinone/menaquinone biosynthesis C-methylase UbiE
MSSLTRNFRRAISHISSGRWRELKQKTAGKLADYLNAHRTPATGDHQPKSQHEKSLVEFVQRVRQGNYNRQNSEPRWWHELYNAPVYDLGESGIEALDGIYSPLYDLADVDRFVHDQFRSGADHHADKYVLHDMYERYLTIAFDAMGLDLSTTSGLKVLDIGSGAGNTIAPLLKMLPDVQLLASEFSTQMLVALKDVLANIGLADKAGLLQLNAEELDFKKNSLDLVVGGAILHHLFHPEKTIKGCYSILKPGGTAIFFDPFANGNSVMQLLFQIILDLSHENGMSTRVKNTLREFVATIDCMRGDKNDPRFLKLDDKWLFTRDYFIEAGRNAGFTTTTIVPLNCGENLFENQARVVIHEYCDIPKDEWPKWANDVICDFDKMTPPSFKEQLLVEGSIIFRK